MTFPIETLLVSGLVASGIAMLVWIIGRFWWKPAVLHALWVVVLIKLVFPPLIPLPVSIPHGEEISAALRPAENPTEAETERLLIARHDSTAGEGPYDVGSRRLETLDPDEDYGSKTRIIKDPDSPEDNPRVMIIADLTGEPENSSQPPPRRTRKATFPPEMTTVRVLPGEPPASPDVASKEPADPPVGFPWRLTLIWVWATGTVFFILRGIWLIARFHRQLKLAGNAPDWLRGEVEQLAHEMGIATCPRVRMISGTRSPLLWCFGRPTIVLSTELIEALSAEQVRTLILHELSHLRRRDHWVRFVELCATSLYWWLPTAWIARKQLRIAEEECCDALVVSQIERPREYASALVDTIARISGTPAIPPTASGLRQVAFLRRRIRRILDGSHRGRLTVRSRIAMLLVAGCLLPMLPVIAGDLPVDRKSDAEAQANPAKPSKTAKIRLADLPRATVPVDVASSPIGFPTSLEVRTTSFSKDGRLLAIGYGRWTTSGRIELWDFRNRKLLHATSFRRGVASVALSPDGKHLVSVSWDRSVQVRDAKTFRRLSSFPLPSNRIARFQFNPQGTILAAAGEDGKLMFWSTKDWKLIREIKDRPKKHSEPGVYRFQRVCFSPDGQQVCGVGGKFSGRDDRVAYGRGAIWNVATGKLVKRLPRGRAMYGTAVYSEDGTTIAVGTFGSQVILFDAQTAATVGTIEARQGACEAVCWHGDEIISGGHTGSIKVWDSEALREVKSLPNEIGSVIDIRMTPKGATLLTGGLGGLVRLWDSENWESKGILERGGQLRDDRKPVLAIAASPDNRTFATAHDDRSVRIRDLFTGKVRLILRDHKDVVAGLSFHPDGKLLATACFDGVVRLFDTKTGKLIREFKGHRTWVHTVAFSPLGDVLASGGYDKTVRLWNPKTGKLIKAIRGHTAAVRSLMFSPDGSRIITGSSDRLVNIWTRDGKLVHSLKGHTGAVRSVAISADGKQIASAGDDRLVRLWDAENGKSLKNLEGHNGIVRAVAFAPSGNLLVSGGFGNTLRVWNRPEKAAAASLRSHEQAITCLAFSADGRFVLSGGFDGRYQRWGNRMSSVAAVANVTDYSSTVRFALVNPKGTHLISGGESRVVRVQNIATGKVERTIKHTRGLTDGELSPNGKILATASFDSTIRLFDWRTGKGLGELKGHTAQIYDLAWSRDGKHLASGSRDGQAIVWDVTSRKIVHTLVKLEQPITSVDFSQDDSLIGFGSGDWKNWRKPGTVQIFDVKTGARRTKIDVPFEVKCVRFSPKGDQIAAATAGGHLTFWNATTGKRTRDHKLQSGTRRIAFLGENLIAVGNHTGTVRIHHLPSGAMITNYAGHGTRIFDLRLTPDGSALITAAADRAVRVWSTRKTLSEGTTAQRLSRWKPTEPPIPEASLIESHQPHGKTVNFVIRSPNGKLIATGGAGKAGGTATIWEEKSDGTLKKRVTVSVGATVLTTATFTKDSARLIAGAENGELFMWNTENGYRVDRLQTKTGAVRRIVLAPNGNRFAVACQKNKVFIRGLRPSGVNTTAFGPAWLGEIETPTEPLSIAFSPNVRRIAIGTGSLKENREGRIEVWAIDNVQNPVRRAVTKATGFVFDLQFVTNDLLLATNASGGITRWNALRLAAGKIFHKEKNVRAITIDGDRDRVFAAVEGGVKIYRLSDGKALTSWEATKKTVLDVNFSPDGNRVLTASADGSLKVWKLVPKQKSSP